MRLALAFLPFLLAAGFFPPLFFSSCLLFVLFFILRSRDLFPLSSFFTPFTTHLPCMRARTRARACVRARTCRMCSLTIECVLWWQCHCDGQRDAEHICVLDVLRHCHWCTVVPGAAGLAVVGMMMRRRLNVVAARAGAGAVKRGRWMREMHEGQSASEGRALLRSRLSQVYQLVVVLVVAVVVRVL